MKLKKLSRTATECLLEFLRRVTHRPVGQIGMVMTIHTFREYMGVVRGRKADAGSSSNQQVDKRAKQSIEQSTRGRF